MRRSNLMDRLEAELVRTKKRLEKEEKTKKYEEPFGDDDWYDCDRLIIGEAACRSRDQAAIRQAEISREANHVSDYEKGIK